MHRKTNPQAEIHLDCDVTHSKALKKNEAPFDNRPRL